MCRFTKTSPRYQQFTTPLPGAAAGLTRVRLDLCSGADRFSLGPLFRDPADPGPRRQESPRRPTPPHLDPLPCPHVAPSRYLSAPTHSPPHAVCPSASDPHVASTLTRSTPHANPRARVGLTGPRGSFPAPQVPLSPPVRGGPTWAAPGLELA